MDLSYDVSKFALGPLCNHGHDYQHSGQSLRYLKSRRGCVECARARTAKTNQSILQDPKKRKARAERKRRERQEQGRPSRAKGLQGITLPVGAGAKNVQLLAKHGLLCNGMTAQEIIEAADMIRTLSKPASPTVAELVEVEQRRYWRENLGMQSRHMRQHKTDLSWLNYQLNPQLRAYHREKSKRRKAKMRGNVTAQVSAQEIRRRFEQFDGLCAYCGEKGDLHIEHFIPLSKGGTHTLGNIVPACPKCNYSKRDHDAFTWYKSQSFYSHKRWSRIIKLLGQKEAVGQLSLI